MEVKQFYADDFYRDENGKVYTGQYIEHNSHIKDYHTLTKVESPYEELQGVMVRCNYSQIFYPDSSLLLCNKIPSEEDAEETIEHEIFQYYLIDGGTAERLKRSTNEIIMYSEKLGLHVLGVTHFGTSWDYVGTEFIY